ncbi:MAG: hypothetical protein ACJAZO_002830 [Myxococcota bacterium]
MLNQHDSVPLGRQMSEYPVFSKPLWDVALRAWG